MPDDRPPPLPSFDKPPPLPPVAPARATVVLAKKAEPAIVTRREPERRDEPIERPKPKIGTAMIVIAIVGVLACGGIFTIVLAFTKFTQAVADKKPESKTTIPPMEVKTRESEREATGLPPPVVTPKVAPAPKIPPDAPKIVPPVRPNPPITLTRNAPSPVSIKEGLKLAVSFDETALRDYVMRGKIDSAEPLATTPGSTKQAVRVMMRPTTDDSEPFIIDLGNYLNLFSFKDESPFTIILWARAISTQPITVFALLQSTDESSPKLYVKLDPRGATVELYCDESDSEKKYYRRLTTPYNGLLHIALTRAKDGKLITYFNGNPATDAPADSLPDLQQVKMSFKQAGFARRGPRSNGVLTLDEFALYHRDLSADEIRKLAGKDEKK